MLAQIVELLCVLHKCMLCGHLMYAAMYPLFAKNAVTRFVIR